MITKLRSADHPEANGRTAVGREVEWVVPIGLEDGSVLELHLGRHSRGIVLAAVEQDEQDEQGKPEVGWYVVLNSGGHVMVVEAIKPGMPGGEMAICSWGADDGSRKYDSFYTTSLSRLAPFRATGP